MNPHVLDNHILQALPPATLHHWFQRGQIVSLRAGETLIRPGDEPAWTYFPLTAILVWVNLMENGATTAVAMVGREGATGLENLPGTNNHLMVQCSGLSLRLQPEHFRESLPLMPGVHAMCKALVRAFVTQITQTAACNRHHSLEQQLIRLLLFTLDRSEGPTLQMTHEQMARMLGVRREGVSYAASLLQHRGWIGYSRGRITLFDRQALVEHACECYHLVSLAYQAMDRYRVFTPEPSGCESHSGSDLPLCAVQPCA